MKVNSSFLFSKTYYSQMRKCVFVSNSNRKCYVQLPITWRMPHNKYTLGMTDVQARNWWGVKDADENVALDIQLLIRWDNLIIIRCNMDIIIIIYKLAQKKKSPPSIRVYYFYVISGNNILYNSCFTNGTVIVV